MKAHPILQIHSCSTEQAIEALRKLTDDAEPIRWIEFPSSVLLLIIVPDDSESGAVYVLHRKSRTWFWVDFEDEQYGGYSASDFDLLVNEYDFLRLVERPGLLRATPGWILEPGKLSEMAAPCN
jgi:hypothetical protein